VSLAPYFQRHRCGQWGGGALFHPCG
jgi:hypothetical protein